MSTSGSKSNEHVAHFIVDIHTLAGHNIIATDPAGLLEYLMIFKQKYSGPFAFLEK